MPLPSHLLCCQLQKKHSHSCVQMQMSNSKKKDHSFQEAVLNLHIVKSLFFYHWNILVLQSSSSLLFSSSSLFSFLTFKEIIFFKKSFIQAKLSKRKNKPVFPLLKTFVLLNIRHMPTKQKLRRLLIRSESRTLDKICRKKVKALSWRNLGFRLLFSHYGCIESF